MSKALPATTRLANDYEHAYNMTGQHVEGAALMDTPFRHPTAIQITNCGTFKKLMLDSNSKVIVVGVV